MNTQMHLIGILRVIRCKDISEYSHETNENDKAETGNPKIILFEFFECRCRKS